MNKQNILLIDGWYDLHKTKRNRIDKNNEVETLWEIPISEFMRMLFPDYYQKDIYRAEVYRTHCVNDFRIFSEYMYKEDSVSGTYKRLEEYIRRAIQESKLDKIYERMDELLQKYKGAVADKEVLLSWKEPLDEIRNNENYNIDINKWVQFFHYYLFYAVTGRLHPNLGYAKYPDLDKDLGEYNRNVVMGYGCSGIPGMSKIYALANRKKPNIIALYELGEMEYYGRGPSGIVNYEKAYDYYYQTLELNSSHPLALWSIAYMKFNYKRPNTELEYACISKLDNEFPNEIETRTGTGKYRAWFEDILNKVTNSYGYGCAAAANLIGKIIDASEDDFPSAYRGWLEGRRAMEFYKESADKNYSFGCNNYALGCLKRAEKEKKEKAIRAYVEQAIKYFKKSAMEGEVWAANKLGKLYIKGLEINGYKILDEDENEAYKYFMLAESFFGVRKYYWALINMCDYLYCNEKSKYYKSISADVLLEKLKRALEILSESQDDQIKEIKKNIEIISNWKE